MSTLHEKIGMKFSQTVKANKPSWHGGVHPQEYHLDSHIYYDDISDAPLDTKLVMAAIAEELAEHDQHKVYEERPIEECWERIGKKPVGIRWVIVNKGDDVNPNYRARLVAKKLKVDERLDLCAATPPLEAKKLFFTRAATARGKNANEYKLIFIHIKRAYFYAPETREIDVDLPEQHASPGKYESVLADLSFI